MQSWKKRPNMKRKRPRLVRGFCCAAFLAGIAPFAHAAEEPTPFSFDAGPLGHLELSGGLTGIPTALRAQVANSTMAYLGQAPASALSL